MSENKSFDELLLPVRNDIDRIDKELLKLFTERMQCAERVAEIKRKAGIPVLNAAREQVILDRVKKEAGEYGDSAVALYSAIMSISRARQHNMLKSGGVLRDLEQNSPKTLKADPRIICQGAAGAFSHSAALRLFPEQKPIFLPGFRDVFEAVHNGAGDYGVVPVENSDAGSVSEVYDLIMKHRMFIVGAADIPVRHCLCRAKGTGAVKKVLSKHEALVQCSAYLAAHVIETEDYSNTAAAANSSPKPVPRASAQSAPRRRRRNTASKSSPPISRIPITTARASSSFRVKPFCPKTRKRSACASLCRTPRARCAIRWSVSLCSA